MRWAIVIVAVMISTAVAAPRTARGVVTAAGSSRAIVGATVYTEHGAIATTDNDGYFALEVDPRERELTVAAPGYEARTARIEDDLMRIELEPAGGADPARRPAHPVLVRRARAARDVAARHRGLPRRRRGPDRVSLRRGHL